MTEVLSLEIFKFQLLTRSLFKQFAQMVTSVVVAIVFAFWVEVVIIEGAVTLIEGHPISSVKSYKSKSSRGHKSANFIQSKHHRTTLLLSPGNRVFRHIWRRRYSRSHHCKWTLPCWALTHVKQSHSSIHNMIPYQWWYFQQYYYSPAGGGYWLLTIHLQGVGQSSSSVRSGQSNLVSQRWEKSMQAPSLHLGLQCLWKCCK